MSPKKNELLKLLLLSAFLNMRSYILTDLKHERKVFRTDRVPGKLGEPRGDGWVEQSQPKNLNFMGDQLINPVGKR
jgi:hypothetical protein